MSEPIPQKLAPTQSPTSYDELVFEEGRGEEEAERRLLDWERARYSFRGGLSSRIMVGRMMATVCGHNYGDQSVTIINRIYVHNRHTLSAHHPNPATKNSPH
jgi:hypothetical protein